MEYTVATIEAAAMESWRAWTVTSALAWNQRADELFAVRCESWLAQNAILRALGKPLEPKPVHLPVCAAGVDNQGMPTLTYALSTVTCPDLPPEAPAPLPAGVEDVGLVMNSLGWRYSGARDTMPAGHITEKDGKRYLKVITQSFAGPMPRYEPISA